MQMINKFFISFVTFTLSLQSILIKTKHIMKTLGAILPGAKLSTEFQVIS